jgi:hypothetical protein
MIKKPAFDFSIRDWDWIAGYRPVMDARPRPDHWQTPDGRTVLYGNKAKSAQTGEVHYRAAEDLTTPEDKKKPGYGVVIVQTK